MTTAAIKWTQVGPVGWLLVLVALFSGSDCRPQTGQDVGTNVEIEKQNILEVDLPEHPQPTQRKIEADTREILEKIAEVNKKHGLTPRKQKPNYFHFPLSYYSRSEQDKRKNEERQRSGFKFATSPFTNPIFDYVEKQPDDTIGTVKHHIQEQTPSQGYKISMINPNAEVTPEDQIPGQYVKRKIVHQQTYIIPSSNPSLYPASVSNMNMYAPMHDVGLPPAVGIGDDPDADQKILNKLEKQTVDNVRNIVSNTQNQQISNPFGQYSSSLQGELALVALGNPENGKYGLVNLKDLSTPNGAYQVYGPFQLANVGTRQAVNWPFAQYFPIHIRDPFTQMYNAITSMIEYGPNAGQVNPCPGRPPSKKKSRSEEPKDEKVEVETSSTTENTKTDTAGLDKKSEKLVLETSNDTLSEVAKEDLDPKVNTTIKEALIEDGTNGSVLHIKETKNSNNETTRVARIMNEKNDTIVSIKEAREGVSFNIDLSLNDREGKIAERSQVKPNWDKVKVSGDANALVVNTSRISSKFAEVPKDVRQFIIPRNPTTSKPILSPPNRDPTHQTQEFGDESEDDKSDELLISNDGNKKLFSRDNTGSGVFIHKLKVRKGGVAIAGPGGIATAGSGGTAIVGPNGVAYTQPDSLAIAGSGSKVVAVDPTVNLGDIIGNSTSLNNFNRTHAFPPSRIGRVVAVGPVVYYNKG
ncbi:unnamed protein product [Callosobruchus maculatus]|uniref:DUF4774 domain-containing protein n=1 Tax=Callosobruchus maculatus TaxID=64391 RepID=A0A653DWR0_CALMS|nr:unnamed protein product [Callosobruchus maculatus]